MTKVPIFARVQPKSIKLNEKYTFSIVIDSINDNIEPGEEEPEGRLEINVPYDGVEFVTEQTFKDIKRQIPKRSQDEQTEVRIGYLGFAGYDRTNILDNLNLNSTDVLPLDFPIKAKELADKQKGGNHFACRFHHDYTPQWPDIFPMQLTINVLDEEDIGEINEELLKILDELKTRGDETWPPGFAQERARYENEIVQKIERLLRSHTHFKPILRFYFNIILALPRHFLPEEEEDKEFDTTSNPENGALEKDESNDIEYGSKQENTKESDDSQRKTGEEKEKEKPKITRLSIQWPMTNSPRDARLWIKGMQRQRAHNPEGVIEWYDIEFPHPGNLSTGTDLYHFKAPTISLSVQPPGELYHRDYLEGNIEVTLPQSLSGLQISYFDVMGQKVSDAVNYKTTLTTHFKIFLRTCFEQKKYLPTQQLEFEGVVLDEFRLSDIQRVLEDVGFVSDYQEIVENQFYLVNGEKGDRTDQTKLWMIVKGKSAQTTRERTIPGEHTYRTSLDTGHTTINMYGSIRGDRTNLVELMNSIHNRLKDQFYHVSTID